MRVPRWVCEMGVLIAVALVVGGRPSEAGNPAQEDPHEAVLRLTAENQLLTSRLERLEKRVAELEARLAAATAAKSTSDPKPPAVGPVATGPAQAPAAAGTSPAAAGQPQVNDAQIVDRLPTKRAFRHALHISLDWMEVVLRTLVRLQPHPLKVVTGPRDLALGALATYEGRTCRKLPSSIQLDFSTTDASWTRDEDRRVVFYAKKKRYELGQASYTEDHTASGARKVFMAVQVPVLTLLDMLAETEIEGTIGRAEFVVSEASAEALRDILFRLTPVK